MIGQLIKYFKRMMFNKHFSSVKVFIKHERAIFLTSFKLIINFPKKQQTYLTVGNDTMLECAVIFESDSGEVNIGNNSFIGNSTLICRSKIEIGENVFIAWGCTLYDHNSHSIDYRERQNDIRQQLNDFENGNSFILNKNWNVVNSKPITICDNAWIGMNCTILKGVTIGEGAIVGACSVVTNDVAPWTVVGGNPAVLIKKIPDNLRKQ